MDTMDFTQAWLIVLGLAAGTFLIRYSFIGLFANRDMPGWLAHSLKLMVPAIFAAIMGSGIAMVGGQMAGLELWPRYAAGCVGLAVAVYSGGKVLPTVAAGMAALHGLPWLLGRVI
jgi:branched-subunit amino acid transport protein